MGVFDSALIEFDKYLKASQNAQPDVSSRFRYYRVLLLARGGDLATAKQMAKKFKTDDSDENNDPHDYYMAMGLISFVEGDMPNATGYFEKAISGPGEFYNKYMLGRTYLESGRYEDAFNTLWSIGYVYGKWSTFIGLWDIKLLYYIARAFEGKGDKQNAISHYSHFLMIMKNAEPSITEVEDAKRRLANIKESS
jgi:tetratricopeptide (TPR) repeat protein